MAFQFRLEHESTVTNWRVGDTIPLGRERTLRVVGIVVSNEDEPVRPDR